MKRILKFVATTIAQDFLSSAGQQIGTAVGNRIGRKIDPEGFKQAEEEEEDGEETTRV